MVKKSDLEARLEAKEQRIVFLEERTTQLIKARVDIGVLERSFNAVHVTLDSFREMQRATMNELNSLRSKIESSNVVELNRAIGRAMEAINRINRM